jgi:hypothetical protein
VRYNSSGKRIGRAVNRKIGQRMIALKFRGYMSG